MQTVFITSGLARVDSGALAQARPIHTASGSQIFGATFSRNHGEEYSGFAILNGCRLRAGSQYTFSRNQVMEAGGGGGGSLQLYR